MLLHWSNKTKIKKKLKKGLFIRLRRSIRLATTRTNNCMNGGRTANCINTPIVVYLTVN